MKSNLLKCDRKGEKGDNSQMKRYKKVLVAFKDEELNCFAERGEWLIVADKKDTKKGLFRLPHYKYFFVFLTSNRAPSEYGVVKQLDHYITAKQMAELDFQSQNKEIKLIDQSVIQYYERFLDMINNQPAHTPMAVTWKEKILPIKEKELKVHKVFFTGMSKEEKEQLFNV